MEKFDRLAKRVGNFLECFAEISMAVFGLCLIGFVFVELWQLVKLSPLFAGHLTSFDPVLEKIITFFLLFEFLAMAAAAMQNHGHLAAVFFDQLRNHGLTAGIDCRAWHANAKHTDQLGDSGLDYW